MINPADSNLTVELKKYFIIAPDISLKKKIIKKFKGIVKNNFHYKSDLNSKFLNENELKKIISHETGHSSSNFGTSYGLSGLRNKKDLKILIY